MRRDHPCLPEHAPRRRRPTARADPTRDRSELALRGGRQHEDDTCLSARRRHSGESVTIGSAPLCQPLTECLTCRATMARCASCTSSRDRTAGVPRSWPSSSPTSSMRSGTTTEVVALALAFDGGVDPRLPPLVPTTSIGPVTLLRSGWRLREAVVGVACGRRHRARRLGSAGHCARLAADAMAGWCGSGYSACPTAPGTGCAARTGAGRGRSTPRS